MKRLNRLFARSSSASPLALSVGLALLLILLSAPSAQAEFGITPGTFQATFKDDADAPLTTSGAHPHTYTTSFDLNTIDHPELGIFADEKLRDQTLFQAPGFVGNATAAPTCTAAQFLTSSCPRDSQVGSADTLVGAGTPFVFEDSAVVNMVPALGVAAKLGFHVDTVAVSVDVTVNPDPPHNLIARAANVSQILPLLGVEFTLWGTPADPAHDAARGGPAGVPPTAFLTVPRACQGPLSTDYEITSWLGSTDSGSDPMPGFEDCAALGFSPQVAAAPTTNVASSPSGFDFSIQVDDPGLTDPAPGARADSDLKKAVVTLPEGITVNPAAAGGLAACSQADLAREAYDSAPGEGCPQASKVATVEVETPLLDELLTGSIFLATPYDNPLGTLLAGYLVIKQPQRGIVIKLAGKIETDPASGQITASFDQNPQLPFSDLEVSFFGGAKGPLITPQACGNYEVLTELHPWSGNPPDVSTQPFEIVQAPGGGPCPASEAQLPHAPGFDAGSTSPLAGHHSPFVVNLRRSDGSQRFRTVTLKPPPGLTAKLAGTPYCPEAALAAAATNSGKAEQASPSCPAASRVGSVHAAAGAGPAPYWAPGTAYLSGPYKGAPLSMAIVTPAVAGPFDLGVVVVRTALHVDPRTAEITAVSDPIPELLQGIPLDVRVASIRLDKPNFTLNGTSCNPFAVTGQLASTLGAVANLHSRFQLGECRRLGFKPRLGLHLFGGVKRGKHQALRAVVRPRPGDANIGRTVVRMPRSAFLAQEHIRTICTRVQFAAEVCPKGSVYGRAIAYSPLLDYPLKGNVYLRSSDNTLPDLVADLRGPAHQPIRIELVGRTDSAKGALRNTFDVVPDAPVSYFRLQLFGGKKGLIVNSRNVCKGTNRAGVRMDAQNGRRQILRPVVGNPRCKKLRRKAKRRAAKRKRAKQRGRGSARRSSLSAAWRTG